MRSIETEYAGRRFRSRLEARWAVFLDACHADWEYEPQGYVLDDGTRYLPDFQVRGVRLRHADGMDVADIAIEVKGVMDPASEAKVKAYAEERPILVLGGLPHGPNHVANLSYGLEGDGAVALLEPAGRRFVVPGIDDDGRFALFDAGWPALAYLESRPTRDAYAKAAMAGFEFGQTPEPPVDETMGEDEPSAAEPVGGGSAARKPISPDGLSDKEMKAVQGVVCQGFAPIGRGAHFKREFLANTGLTTVLRKGRFVLAVGDEGVFAPYRQALLRLARADGGFAFEEPDDAERFAIREIAEKGFTVSAENPYLGRRRYSRKFIRAAGLSTGRRCGRFGLMVENKAVFASYLAMVEDSSASIPGTHADGWNPKGEDES